MQLGVAYRGRSGVVETAGGLGLSFAPNLRHDPVSFVGDLLRPLAFREAVSALHDVVVSDLKYKPKDHSAYQAYLERERQTATRLRQSFQKQELARLRSIEVEPMPAGLEERFQKLRSRYWNARSRYATYLALFDPTLFRLLVPCDPVVTVADDVVFFECFSKDESSYGCLTAERGEFAAQREVAVGTTNVDYSLGLYEEFQRLRSYRPARFAVDPSGFEAAVGAETHREEKIDLPPSWLRGFMQLQGAMSLPSRRVTLGRECLYNLLAALRKRTRKGPRAVRFVLTPGRPAELVVEPWELHLPSHGSPYDGPKAETIRVWGRNRLLTLARCLPIVDSVEVRLLGTGLPSFWTLRMGGLRFLLGLSGWSANDWTSGGGALTDLAAPVVPSEDLLGDVADAFRERSAWPFGDLQRRTGAAPAALAAALHRFALLGQVIHDLSAGLYRWRAILPVELSLKQVETESDEAREGRLLYERRSATVKRDETVANVRVIAGRVENRDCELVIDEDGRAARGQCNCSHYFRFKLRAGPCRHMLALRRKADAGAQPAGLEQWFRAWTGA